MLLQTLVILHKLNNLRERYKKLPPSQIIGALVSNSAEALDLSMQIHTVERQLFDSLQQGGLFEFVDLVGKVRCAQLEYAEMRQKNEPEVICSVGLAFARALEKKLDKEMILFNTETINT